MKLSEIIQHAKLPRSISSFYHHLAPEMLLSMCESLYHYVPEAILVSVRGYQFGFETELSPFTKSLVNEAVARTVGWLKQDHSLVYA